MFLVESQSHHGSFAYFACRETTLLYVTNFGLPSIKVTSAKEQ